MEALSILQVKAEALASPGGSSAMALASTHPPSGAFLGVKQEGAGEATQATTPPPRPVKFASPAARRVRSRGGSSSGSNKKPKLRLSLDDHVCNDNCCCKTEDAALFKDLFEDEPMDDVKDEVSGSRRL